MKIPCYPQSESAKPLSRVLGRTSERRDMARHEVSEVVAEFLEGIIEEVARGHVVSVPGFGAFGPWLIETRSALARDPSLRCKPKFSPARAFTLQVRNSAPASRSGKRKLSRHRRNHHHSAKRADRDRGVVMTKEQILASIQAQLSS